MSDIWIRPLSELNQVDWHSFELKTLEGDERIPCEDIPNLLHKLAAGETYTGPLGNELAVSLLDLYEYTMHLQFTPVLNEVLPFLLGLLDGSQQPKVTTEVLRFLAWAFTAAHSSTDPAFVFEAFDIELDDDDSYSDSLIIVDVQRVIVAAQQFLAKLPHVIAAVQHFKASDNFSIRGAATRLLFTSGVLQHQTTDQLAQLLTGRTEEDIMLNLLELEHFIFNLYPVDQQRSAIEAVAQQVFEQSDSLGVRWQAVSALGAGKGSERNAALNEVIRYPHIIERQFRMVTEVAAIEFHGYTSLNEYFEMAVLPTLEDLGENAVPLAIRFFSARLQSVLEGEDTIRVTLALMQDFQLCQRSGGSSYSVQYAPEILRRLREIPATEALERAEIIKHLDRCLELNTESFSYLNRGAMRHLLMYWLALRLRSTTLYEDLASFEVAQ